MSDRASLFVKSCGMRDAGTARVAVEAGADALGFILAPSRRQVTSTQVAEIRRTLDLERGEGPVLVGVTVNASASSIAEDVDRGELDVIQLSGDEPVSLLAEVDVPVIKALRFAGGTSLDDALRAVDAWFSAPTPAARVIVEGHRDGAYGGTGTRADWEFVARIAERYPIVLAGGLDPENVSEAIGIVGPAGVDVSSGTETDGVKDPVKIRAFIGAARLEASRQ